MPTSKVTGLHCRTCQGADAGRWRAEPPAFLPSPPMVRSVNAGRQFSDPSGRSPLSSPRLCQPNRMSYPTYLAPPASAFSFWPLSLPSHRPTPTAPALLAHNSGGPHMETARRKMTCILTIDGGGIRGIIPAAVLLFLETQLQKLDGQHVRITDYFDVIAGTSTGGIIGGILTAPNEQGRPRYDATNVMNFYVNEGPKIFARRGFPIFTQITGPKHDAAILETILEDNLRDLKMKDTLSELLIPTFDIKHMQPTYFSTSEARRDELKNAYVRDVLRGTSAAPTYFSPKVFSTMNSNGRTQEFNLVDGGVGINNPAHLCLAHTVLGESKMKGGEAIDIEDYKNVLILSLGTGKVVKSYDGKEARKWGVLSWVLNNGQVPLLDIVSECSADVVDYNLSVFFSVLHRLENYLRIQAFDMAKNVQSLDNVTSENIQKLREIGENLLDLPMSNTNIETGETFTERGRGTNKEALIRFAERLSFEYRSRQASKSKVHNPHE